MRISAIGDLHVGMGDGGRHRAMLHEMATESELVVLLGDLTDLGLAREAQILADDLATCAVPIIAVLGNHDHYSGEVSQIVSLLSGAGVRILEGEGCEVNDVTFIGLKGSGGGFGRMLNPIAEPEVLAFTQLPARDAAVLDRLLAEVDIGPRIVLLHYAPIVETIRGEHPEEYVFMGSSRFADVIDRHQPDLVLHGHSHFGVFAGATAGGVPVRNVAMTVAKPEGKPYALFDISEGLEAVAAQGPRRPSP